MIYYVYKLKRGGRAIKEIIDDKLYSLTDASKAIEKNVHYFGNLKKQRPEYFDEVELLSIGSVVVLKGSDIKKVLKRVKKEGDPPLIK